MIFKQLQEDESSTFTYLFGCESCKKAVLVDPVLETFERDLDIIHDLDMELAYTVDTHIHADHITAALKLQSVASSKIVAPAATGLACADWLISEAEPFEMGEIKLNPLFTPGHTDHHHCYLFQGADQDMVFTGDCLLIDGCGRTDFQSGSSTDLYKSVHEKLFVLDGETLVYPAHDYNGRRVSSIDQERTRNPRLKDGISEAEFIKIMDELDLAYPKKIDMAVPANERCGRCPDDVPDHLQKLCDISQQG